jgi:GH18 family chitinase
MLPERKYEINNKNHQVRIIMKRITIFYTMAMCAFLSLNSPSFANSDITKQQKIIASYFGIWTDTNNGVQQTWQEKLNENTPLQDVNRLYIAFADPNLKSNGHYNLEWYLPKNGNNSQQQQTILADKRVKQLLDAMYTDHFTNKQKYEVFVVIGGGTTGQVGSLAGAANDPQFPSAVVTFLKKYHLDGVDLDWENADDINNNLLPMVQSLYPALHAAGYKLTLSVMPYNSGYVNGNSYTYSSELYQYVDQINIMSYGTEDTNMSVHVESYNNIGFDNSQMILGIDTETGYSDTSGQITDTLGNNGTIQQKASYALQNGLAGMMSWRLGNDYAPKDNLNTPTYKGAECLHQVMISGSCRIDS